MIKAYRTTNRLIDAVLKLDIELVLELAGSKIDSKHKGLLVAKTMLMDYEDQENNDKRLNTSQLDKLKSIIQILESSIKKIKGVQQ